MKYNQFVLHSQESWQALGFVGHLRLWRFEGEGHHPIQIPLSLEKYMYMKQGYFYHLDRCWPKCDVILHKCKFLIRSRLPLSRVFPLQAAHCQLKLHWLPWGWETYLCWTNRTWSLLTCSSNGSNVLLLNAAREKQLSLYTHVRMLLIQRLVSWCSGII